MVNASAPSLANGVSTPESRDSSGMPSDSNAKTSTGRRSLRGSVKSDPYAKGAKLTIDLVNIRKKLNFKDGLQREDHRPRKRVKREEIRCHCYLAIWDNREGYRSVEPIVKRNHRCTIIPSTHDGVPVLDITMDRPVQFDASELFVPLKSNGPTKMGMGDKYTLETKIIPSSSADPWPIIPILSKHEGSLIKDHNQTHPSGYLVASYVNLPTAPAPEVPMSISLDQDGRTYKTKYGLEVRAHWSAQSSQLETVFPPRTKRRSPSPEQCPTPQSEAGSPSYLDLFATENMPAIAKEQHESPAEPKAQVCYQWAYTVANQPKKDFLPGIFEGFRCYCSSRVFRSLKLLRFHLASNHDKYIFELDEASNAKATAAFKRYTFKVKPVPIVRERAANHIKDEREIVWQKPKKPFDIEAYNEGDDSWTGDLSIRKRRGLAIVSDSPGRKGFSRERKQPEDTPEIPKPRRRRFKVPVAKTKTKTSFFRSTSSRMLETGEELSESDEDVDISWLRDKHLSNLAQNEYLDEAEKEFMCKWDEHIMGEGFPLPRYIPDSLVRFTRANVAFLKRPHIFQQFEEHTANLLRRNVISDITARYCNGLITDTTPADEHEDNENSPNSEMDIDQSTTTGQYDSEGARKLPLGTYGICAVCEESTTRRKNLTIFCSNAVSENHPALNNLIIGLIYYVWQSSVQLRTQAITFTASA